MFEQRVTQAVRKKQQNNDYRFVDVISCKLTLLMSINLRHGILLSALFAFRSLVMFSFYYYFTCLVIYITWVSFVHSSGKAKERNHVTTVETCRIKVTFGRLFCYTFF